MEHDEILETINAYLAGYDPEFPGFDDAPPKPPEPQTATPTPTTSRRNVPIVGCVVQRSDAQNQRKNAWLTAAPPPPPPRRKPDDPPARPTLTPARVVGPAPPPPIPVQIEPGHVVDVPHFGAHVSRQYKTYSRGAKWHIRFNACGTVRTIRKVRPAK